MGSPSRCRLTMAAIACAWLVMACSGSTTMVAGETTAADPGGPPPTLEMEPTFEPTTSPAPTPVPTPAPSATPTPTPTPTVTPTPAPEGPCGVGPLALPDPDRPVYQGSLMIDPTTRTVVGSVDITFIPDLSVDELVVRLWPNGPRTRERGVDMTLGEVTVDGLVHGVTYDDPTLARVPLAAPVPAGTAIEVTMPFELVVPTVLRSRLSAADDFMRLGTILPLLPWEPGFGWATDPPTTLFAESVLSPSADFAVRVDVPDGYDVLASGTPDGDGVWRVEAARDFAVSVGRFRKVTATAFAPEPVEIVVGVHETLSDDPQAYLDKVVDSLEQFSRRFGQYPWPSLTFALTPNLAGGIEFPTHIMQGPNTLGRTTSHEIGHMFFYSLVGNNQGADPWLDEGLASYAEFTYEGTAPNSSAIPADGVGEATEPMTFWEARGGSYYPSVYTQTGFALQLLGDQADVDCALARYVAANAHGIARPGDLIEAFEPTFPDVVDRLRELGVDVTE